MIKLAHIVNPYQSKDAEAMDIQAFTLKSMQQAKLATKKAAVELFAAMHSAEQFPLVSGIEATSPLKRTVVDIADFERKIPYALIEDILAKTENIDCDYVIFSNMDIIVQPYFYDYIAAEIEKGFHGIIINRRRVSLRHLDNSNLEQILADPGKYHPGYDCFIVHKSYLKKFILKDICVGIPFIGVSMAHNIFSFVQPYKIIDKQHLTAHIGLQVMGGRSQEYYRHNYSAFQKIRKQLKPFLKKENLPFSELPLAKRILAWGLNPSTPVLLNLEVEGKGLFEKLYFYWNELRFKILEKLSSSN